MRRRREVTREPAAQVGCRRGGRNHRPTRTHDVGVAARCSRQLTLMRPVRISSAGTSSHRAAGQEPWAGGLGLSPAGRLVAGGVIERQQVVDPRDAQVWTPRGGQPREGVGRPDAGRDRDGQ
jgi:hypothetical protein